MVFGEDLNLLELGLKMGPKDMQKRNVDKLFDVALDVAELQVCHLHSMLGLKHNMKQKLMVRCEWLRRWSWQQVELQPGYMTSPGNHINVMDFFISRMELLSWIW